MSGHADVFDLIIGLRTWREAYILVTFTKTTDSTSAKPGAGLLLIGDGTTLAEWVGGSCAEAAVREAALDCLNDDAPDDEVLGTVSRDDLVRMYAPAGLSLNAENPEEIALSILSEIVTRRRGRVPCPCGKKRSRPQI